jgi:succinate dehydrogenase / fumarate reductase cytochrome b subunit
MSRQSPLSPFMLPIWYRFQLTSALSIAHRLTGLALSVGSIALCGWLIAVAHGDEWFARAHELLISPAGLSLLFLWSLTFFYHLCSGVRHLLWDVGYALELKAAYRGGYLVLAATVVLTAASWTYLFLA